MRNGSFGFLSGLFYLTLTSRTELFSIYVQTVQTILFLEKSYVCSKSFGFRTDRHSIDCNQPFKHLVIFEDQAAYSFSNNSTAFRTWN